MLQANNLNGTPAVGVFTSSTTLSATEWLGQNQSAAFTFTPTWYTAGSTQTGYDQGQIAIAITAAQLSARPRGANIIS